MFIFNVAPKLRFLLQANNTKDNEVAVRHCKSNAETKNRPRFAAPAGYPALLDCSGGCATRPGGAHTTRIAAELKQCAPKSPDQPALLGGAQGRVKQNAKHQLQLSGTLLQDWMGECAPQTEGQHRVLIGTLTRTQNKHEYFLRWQNMVFADRLLPHVTVKCIGR
jgi:hypothetical protein